MLKVRQEGIIVIQLDLKVVWMWFKIIWLLKFCKVIGKCQFKEDYEYYGNMHNMIEFNKINIYVKLYFKTIKV